MRAVLDSLCAATTAIFADYSGRKRPTWAPPLVLGDELADTLRQLGWLGVDDKPVARLWARFSDPSRGPVACHGFELQAGIKRSGKRFFETLLGNTGKWHNGPLWVPSSRFPDGTWNTTKLPLARRAVELGAERVADFAGNPGDQMLIAGSLSGHCAMCGRRLTDPISLERGIGPECWGRR